MPGTLQEFLTQGYSPHSPQGKATLLLLRKAAMDLSMEYVTVVSKNNTIILNTSFHKNRTG